jgi:hypothetical protein
MLEKKEWYTRKSNKKIEGKRHQKKSKHTCVVRLLYAGHGSNIIRTRCAGFGTEGIRDVTEVIVFLKFLRKKFH